MHTPLAVIQIAGFMVLALLCVAFYGVLMLLFGAVARVFCWMRRFMGFDAGPGPVLPQPSLSAEFCPHARCGHANPSNARFCARCGRALRRAFDDAVA